MEASKRDRNVIGRKRGAFFLLFLLLLLGLARGLTVSAYAEESGTEGKMPEGFDTLTEYLPEEVSERLPSEIASDEAAEVEEAILALTDPRALFSLIGDFAGAELQDGLRLLATLCGFLVLSAVFGTVRRSLGSDALSGAVRFCTSAAIFAAIIHMQIQHLQQIRQFFERLGAVMSALIPMAGTVWAMGGNVTTASAGTATLSLMLTAFETVCGKTVMPLSYFCMALALCHTLASDTGLGGLARAVKRVYTFSLGLMMTVLLASLGSQTALTAAADSTAARTAKAVSSAVIPVVGGSVGETLRTVASGVQYLKSVLGIGGILLIFFLLLPTLLSLLITRLVFLLASGVAELLGCESDGRLLSELGSIYGCLTAVVSMTSVMFILALSIFVKTVVAAA